MAANTGMWFAALTVTPHSPVGEFPKLTRRSSHGYEDAEGFVHPLHLEETRGQIERIDRVVEATGIKLTAG